MAARPSGASDERQAGLDRTLLRRLRGRGYLQASPRPDDDRRRTTAWFTQLTLNTAHLHFDANYAAKTAFGRPLVNSCFTLALVTGQSVSDISQNVFANLGWDEVRLPHPVYEGDTIYAESEVLRRESPARSRTSASSRSGPSATIRMARSSSASGAPSWSIAVARDRSRPTGPSQSAAETGRASLRLGDLANQIRCAGCEPVARPDDALHPVRDLTPLTLALDQETQRPAALADLSVHETAEGQISAIL